ncbi:hypothetical protein NT6N_09880 [Oceaniferula spumae]|uniref:Uncharacterized protein n=1 Tax=Oceaniferula spumae TaxID=2979115 RepID=A0AAT9FIV4_9BACT
MDGVRRAASEYYSVTGLKCKHQPVCFADTFHGKNAHLNILITRTSLIALTGHVRWIDRTQGILETFRDCGLDTSGRRRDSE